MLGEVLKVNCGEGLKVRWEGEVEGSLGEGLIVHCGEGLKVHCGEGLNVCWGRG